MRLLCAFLLTLSLSALADSPQPLTPTLREVATKRGFLIGTATSGALLTRDAAYAAIVAREFNILTPENDMKWIAIHPASNRYDWAVADRHVAFAEAHGMTVHGHNLCWHLGPPAWIGEKPRSREDLLQILTNHIATVVGHYRGRVALWDVVNEAIDETVPDHLRHSVWRDGTVSYTHLTLPTIYSV